MKNIETIGYRNVVVEKESLGRINGVRITIENDVVAIYDEKNALALVDAIMDLVQDVPTTDPQFVASQVDETKALVDRMDGYVAQLVNDVDDLTNRVRALEAAANEDTTPLYDPTVTYQQNEVVLGASGKKYRVGQRGGFSGGTAGLDDPDECKFVKRPNQPYYGGRIIHWYEVAAR